MLRDAACELLSPRTASATPLAPASSAVDAWQIPGVVGLDRVITALCYTEPGLGTLRARERVNPVLR